MIRLEGLTKTYRSAQGEVTAVDHISFEVEAGHTCVLLGPSGCGKTTTLRMINRLVAPTSGKVFIGGVDTDTIERRMDRAAPLRRQPGGEAAGEDAEALASIGIDLDEIRRRVEESFGPGALDQAPEPAQGTRRITMTREAKQSVELAAREARALRHGYVGTEHLLLGLIGAAQRNPRGDFSPQTLRDLGIDPAQARQRVLDELRRAST